MIQNEKEITDLVEHIITRQIKQLQEKFFGKLNADLKNENGNASVKQSGNGIVYVDNTGIAYAMVLFYYHFMDEEHKKAMNIDEILGRLDGIISENRKTFTDVIESLKPSEE
ncbi:hypothetical protein [Paenibacillus durus]|uniref:Uncharacterized protein n=1 Tax=Paenibacillus durus ATCC 35681 TaxID=1333534 RepID=A0A0F7CHX6_PAEDU|nr:hypothetical protein [Paenibacillus durus]AKG34856.1 hypothetical protein VK70_09985 [Paenibacillus durus ATCC 35681]